MTTHAYAVSVAARDIAALVLFDFLASGDDTNLSYVSTPTVRSLETRGWIAACKEYSHARSRRVIRWELTPRGRNALNCVGVAFTATALPVETSTPLQRVANHATEALGHEAAALLWQWCQAMGLQGPPTIGVAREL